MAFLHRLLLRTFSSSSSILSPDSKVPLSAFSKSRKALSLLKSESNPEKILDICRAASLSPHHHLDRLALSVAVSNLSKSNNFSYVKSIVDDLRSRCADERLAAHAIVLFGQATMVNDAVSVFKEFHASSGRGSVTCLNALIFACVLGKDYKEMKRVFMEFPGAYSVEPNVETYNRVIKGFGESGEASSSFSILSEMEKRSVRPNAASFAAVLSGFYAEEKLDDVNKVMLLMKNKYDFNPTLPIYNVRIKCLCKLRRSPDALKLLDEMLEKRIKPNAVTFAELIRGFCLEGKLEEARQLFGEMEWRKLRIGSDVYFTMVDFLSRGGDFGNAAKLCREAMAKGWVPNFTTMKALVMGLRGAGDGEGAKELVAEVKGKVSRKVELWENVEAEMSAS